MSVPDFTLVCGVDKEHLEQLALVFPTWARHKPSLLDRPMLVFRDADQVSAADVFDAVHHPKLMVFDWPLGNGTERWGTDQDKWTNSQRHKMLAGFVHLPALFVSTPYWLKLDTDVVATGQDDWISPDWFTGRPAIVSHRWGFTKPPDQMLQLDAWVDRHASCLPVSLVSSRPLNLRPEAGANRLVHKRIISWCAFFDTTFTRYCSEWARRTQGDWTLPVPSQDGFMWYLAARLGRQVVRINAKRLGWQHWSTRANIARAVEAAMR